MEFFPDSSTIVQVGGLSIRWYALTVVAGSAAAYLTMSKKMKSHGYRISVCEDLLCLIIMGMVIGGRIGWVIESFSSYRLYLWDVLALGDGGLEAITGLFGIFGSVYLYTRLKRMSWRRTMDSIMPSVYLLIIIARVGRCFANPKTWICVLMDLIGLLILVLVYGRYKEGRKRGDLSAMGLIWMGMTRAAACVLSLDVRATHVLPWAFLAEAGGIVLFWYNRWKKTDPKPVILWDFDGTLMDSEEMIILCFRHLFELHGNIGDFNRQKQKEVFGMPLKQAIAMLFPEENVEVLKKEYRDYQMALPSMDKIRLLPHANETLRTLHEEGYRLGVVSSRLSESVLMWMEEFQISDLFDLVVGREQFRRPKPAPDGIIAACDNLWRAHDDCIYIGDNRDDVKAGRAAGAYVVAYVSDEDNRAGIVKAKPNEIITDLNQVLDIVQEDHAWSYDKI